MNKREKAISAITKRSARKQGMVKRDPYPFDEYGVHVFNKEVQREYLSNDVFQALQRAAAMGGALDLPLAEAVAFAMKEWALSKGATHFTHWFQPMTDLTAEKHDSFFNPTGDGRVLAEFTGWMLVQGELDASSFPSGGLRTTFEARGYTAWDPSSPAFLIDRTLIIPSRYLSWTGDALDQKTPLLRSMEALNQQALRILRLFGDHMTTRVFPTVGAEQEYFLIDRYFYTLRPDLLCCNRTLFGAPPPRGQELEDHYLGALSERAMSVMEEVEYELLRIGVPIKTRHNEVAPAQYELSLTYQPANLASDHQMLVMDILKKVAERYGMEALLHEKPFANINGSGKHTNWSLATDRGENLLEPGKNPQVNARFLLFCAAVIAGVHQYAGLLRLGVTSAANDHRLGMHEAPPAIMSVFLGTQLFDIFHKLSHGKMQGVSPYEEVTLAMSMLQPLPRHSSDRNRTSPFAFTGNKFEFRAVGSSKNIAQPVTILNTIIAAQLDRFASELESKVAGGKDFDAAWNKLLVREAKNFQPVLYEGDNYGQVWQKEAKKRGLPNITNTPDAARLYVNPETIALFAKYQVMSKQELVSRQEITLGKYITHILIEARAASEIAHTMLLPAVLSYIKEMGDAAAYMGKGMQTVLKGIVQECTALQQALAVLDEAIEALPSKEKMKTASFARDRLLPAMEKLRRHADVLEGRVADRLWPLPTYQEMLYIT